MSAQPNLPASSYPAYLEGIDYFGQPWPQFETLGAQPAIGEGRTPIADPRDPGLRQGAIILWYKGIC